MQLPIWPFNHKPPATVLRRQGVPFWDYLDERGIPSTFYDLPCDYPASPSKHGHHRCLSGMGTPDMLGTYGTYQHFAEDGPAETRDEAGGKRSGLSFEDETAKARLVGPENTQLKEPQPAGIELARASRPAGQRRGDRTARPQGPACRPANGAPGSSSISGFPAA